MNCQEVMELMQRHLDRDLSDSEHEVMSGHLQQCPECAEMLARLEQLSRELASLPKVTPPFSLVDSILPQLDEIDRAAAAGLSASTIAIGPERKEFVQRPADIRRKQRRIWSMATSGGVVAAGMLLAIVLLNTDGSRIAEDSQLLHMEQFSEGRSQDQKALSERSSAPMAKQALPNEAAATGSARNDNMASPTEGSVPAPDTARSGGGVNASDPSPARNRTAPSSGQSTPPAPGAEIAPNQSASVTDRRDGEGGASTARPANPMEAISSHKLNDAGPADSQQDRTTASSASGQEASGAGTAGAGATTEAPEPGAPERGFGIMTVPQSLPESAEVPQVPQSQPKADGNSVNDVEKKAESVEDPAAKKPAFGIASMADQVTEIPSDDGKHVAVLDSVNRRIVIRTTGEKPVDLFFSSSWGEQDQPKLGRWSGDARFTYSVASSDGVTKTYIVDLKDKSVSIQP